MRQGLLAGGVLESCSLAGLGKPGRASFPLLSSAPIFPVYSKAVLESGRVYATSSKLS
jgi:hypothetical protein